MKLKILAAVVAGAFVLPMAVQAGTVADTMSIDGDIGVAYSTGGTASDSFEEFGTEINFDGSAEVDGITYMGHMEFDTNGNSLNDNNIEADEVRVGMKGGFGEVWIGDADNACDQFDPGPSDIFTGGQSGSCGGSDDGNILYKNKFANTEFAISHNPGQDQSAIGGRFTAGAMKFNLGFEDGVTTSAGTDESLISYGIQGEMAGVILNAEGNDDDKWGVNATYIAGPSTFWVSYGDNGTDDGVGGGFKYSHGKMDYVIEHNEPTDNTVLGLRYRF